METLGERADVLGDARRVTVRVRIPFVDDVRKRLERVRSLAPNDRDACTREVHGDRNGCERDDRPRLELDEEGDGDAEAGFCCSGRELEAELLPLPREQRRPSRYCDDRAGV